MLSLLATAIAIFLAASLCGWVVVLRRWTRHQVILPRHPPIDTPWGLADLLLALVVLSLTQAWAVQLVRGGFAIEPTTGFDDWRVDARAALLLKTSLATLVSFGVSAIWLFVRYRVAAAEMGLKRGRLVADMVLGGAVFVLIAPPVYGLQAVLALFFESKHPLLELLKEDPSPRFFWISAFSAVLVAPVVEEYLFRVLLQSWLERVALRHGLADVLLGGRTNRIDPLIPAKDTLPRPEWPALETHANSPGQDLPGPAAIGTILTSSVLFALMHWSHGPDPAALFLLALALGTVYSHTRRILPCIVAHALLNATSIVSLWLVVHYDK